MFLKWECKFLYQVFYYRCNYRSYLSLNYHIRSLTECIILIIRVILVMIYFTWMTLKTSATIKSLNSTPDPIPEPEQEPKPSPWQDITILKIHVHSVIHTNHSLKTPHSPCNFPWFKYRAFDYDSTGTYDVSHLSILPPRIILKFLSCSPTITNKLFIITMHS